MSITNPIQTARGTAPTAGPLVALACTIACTVVLVAIVQPTVAREALLPLTSALMFVFASAVAVIAWCRPLPHRQFTYWDAVGVLTAMGIVTAALVEPADMVRLVTQEQVSQ